LDSFEWNKITGAILGTLLLAMGLDVVSGVIFARPRLGHPGYALPAAAEVAAGPAATASSPAAPPIDERLAVADVKRGQADTKPCQSCHSFEKGGGAKIGPPLYGVVERNKASVEGFQYSDALKAKGGPWTYPDLDQFLRDPKAYAAGTKMTYAGESDPAKRADIIDYLHTLSDNPPPLPAKPAENAKHGTSSEPPPEPQPARHASAEEATPVVASGGPAIAIEESLSLPAVVPAAASGAPVKPAEVVTPAGHTPKLTARRKK